MTASWTKLMINTQIFRVSIFPQPGMESVLNILQPCTAILLSSATKLSYTLELGHKLPFCLNLRKSKPYFLIYPSTSITLCISAHARVFPCAPPRRWWSSRYDRVFRIICRLVRNRLVATAAPQMRHKTVHCYYGYGPKCKVINDTLWCGSNYLVYL